MSDNIATCKQLRAVRRDLADVIQEQSILEQALTVIGRQTAILIGRSAEARDRLASLEAELASIEQQLAVREKPSKHR